MTDSRSMNLILHDLIHTVDQLRSVVTDLATSAESAERAPRTVTVDDLCVATGLSLETVKKHIRNGVLPGQIVGDRFVIPDLEFDAWRRGDWEPKTPLVRSMRSFVHDVPKTG